MALYQGIDTINKLWYNINMTYFMNIEQRKTEEIQRIVRTLQNDLYITQDRKERLEEELQKLLSQRNVMRETLKKYKR